MEHVVQFLSENPVQYLATVGRDNKAKVRPFMAVGEHDGRIWFCTANTKDVYAEIEVNPWIEVCVASDAFAWMRLNGKAIVEDNRAVKELALQSPLVKGIYKTADNPMFAVFYLADATAVIADFSGEPPKTYEL